LQKRSPILNCICAGIIVVNPNYVIERIAKVEPTAIRIPGDSIGDTEIATLLSHGRVKVNTTQDAIAATQFTGRTIGIYIIAHRGYPEKPRPSARASLRRATGHRLSRYAGPLRLSDCGSHKIT
jgi:hypothetical protein